MIQLWVLPEKAGLPATYKVYQPKLGNSTKVYGGSPDSEVTMENGFPAQTQINIALLEKGQSIELSHSFIVYITRGSGVANHELIEDGDMVRGEHLKFTASGDVQLIIIQSNEHKNDKELH